ncbi:transcription elongation factor Spt5 [Candidatus Nanohalovita haloferacivicina]|uniref:transcription elongation factor Spt5 n=1 Tax=Candidatus Nanohalovita haloferacivicina TaxID=2978046 RepID=UPI00325F9D9A|nr:Transcription antiterminator NusG [Candidatus Nanohalobia archaeon BNXNv]
MILTARTTRGREKTAINALESKVKGKDVDIRAVFHPEDLQGYIFIEGNEADIRKVANDARNINGIIDEEVEVDEIEKYLSEEQEDIKLEVGDKVEVIGGPFKGEEAKINRVDETNREVTIELLDAAVPIPTTVDADMVRKKAQQ